VKSPVPGILPEGLSGHQKRRENREPGEYE